MGYTCLNDVTAPIQKSDVQFTRAKGFDTFCPVGPHIGNRARPTNVLSDTRSTARSAIQQHIPDDLRRRIPSAGFPHDDAEPATSSPRAHPQARLALAGDVVEVSAPVLACCQSVRAPERSTPKPRGLGKIRSSGAP